MLDLQNPCLFHVSSGLSYGFGFVSKLCVPTENSEMKAKWALLTVQVWSVDHVMLYTCIVSHRGPRQLTHPNSHVTVCHKLQEHKHWNVKLKIIILLTVHYDGYNSTDVKKSHDLIKTPKPPIDYVIPVTFHKAYTGKEEEEDH